MSLSRQAILDAQDLQIRTVPVPEWGGDIHIRIMTGVERDAFIKSQGEAAGESQMTVCARFISACACDEAGARLFADADIPMLAGKAATVLARVFKAVLVVNGIGKDGEAEAEKN